MEHAKQAFSSRANPKQNEKCHPILHWHQSKYKIHQSQTGSHVAIGISGGIAGAEMRTAIGSTPAPGAAVGTVAGFAVGSVAFEKNCNKIEGIKMSLVHK